MLVGLDGRKLGDVEFEESSHGGLRVSYKVPWCNICNNWVEKFELHRNTPHPDTDTLVAYCHGRTHEKEIKTQTGISREAQETGTFFDDPRMRTLNGWDNVDAVANRDHEMEELDGRLKSTGLGRVGKEGEIVWGKK